MAAWINAEQVQAWIGADKIDESAAASLAIIATEAVRSLIERDLALATDAVHYFNTNGTNYILLHRWPVRSIGSVLYQEQAIPPAAPRQRGWQIDDINPRKLVFVGYDALPRQPMAVQVNDLITGYDLDQPIGSDTGLPGHVAQALKLTASAIFNSQAADPNLASESISGVFSGTFYGSGVGAVPPGAKTLLIREMRSAP